MTARVQDAFRKYFQQVIADANLVMQGTYCLNIHGESSYVIDAVLGALFVGVGGQLPDEAVLNNEVAGCKHRNMG